MKKGVSTNDILIRTVLKQILAENHYANDHKVRIIEEFGVNHGIARIDIAVVNGIMHGYEIKSDRDTLQRLPEQMDVYSSVFNQITLVVGKTHLYDAINLVPDWWGIITARLDSMGFVIFNTIRNAENNQGLDPFLIARLLWRDEALQILEEAGEATGLRSKPKAYIYEKLTDIFDQNDLSERVRNAIFIREGWRPDAPLMTNGG